VLDQYVNLESLSRDRGYQYKALSSKYNHIADGFHLLQNYTEMVNMFLKSELKNRMHFKLAAEERATIKTIDVQPIKSASPILENKIRFIKDVRSAYQRNESLRKTAEEFKLDRKTVKKYVEMRNIMA